MNKLVGLKLQTTTHKIDQQETISSDSDGEVAAAQKYKISQEEKQDTVASKSGIKIGKQK